MNLKIYNIKRSAKMRNYQSDLYGGGEDKTQINNTRNEKGSITTDMMNNKRIIKEYINYFMPINLTTQMKQTNS